MGMAWSGVGSKWPCTGAQCAGAGRSGLGRETGPSKLMRRARSGDRLEQVGVTCSVGRPARASWRDVLGRETGPSELMRRARSRDRPERVGVTCSVGRPARARIIRCRVQFRELGGLRGCRGGFDSRPCGLRQAVGLTYRRSPSDLVEHRRRRAGNSASTPVARSIRLRVAAGACPGPTA